MKRSTALALVVSWLAYGAAAAAAIRKAASTANSDGGQLVAVLVIGAFALLVGQAWVASRDR